MDCRPGEAAEQMNCRNLTPSLQLSRKPAGHGRNKNQRRWNTLMEQEKKVHYTPLFRDLQGNILMIGFDTFLFDTPEKATVCGENQPFFRAVGVQYTGENREIREMNNGRFITSLMKLEVITFIVGGPEFEKEYSKKK